MAPMLPAILASARIGGLLVLCDPARAERVVVFIDGQNAYMGAREEFGQLVSPSRFGQADPLHSAVSSRGAGAGRPVS
jgi:hypothetical protein